MTNIPIYLITNRHLVSEEKYLKTIREASEFDNINIILREKDLSDNEYMELHNKINRIIGEKKIIINSKINVFNEIGGSELQLSFKAFMKYNKGTEKVGVSVHSIEEAIEADKKGADYLLVSHIFNTKCKEGLTPKGTNFVRRVKEKVSCKVIALGGINFNNFEEVLLAGADGIAVMSLLFNSENIKSDINRFKKKC